MGVSTMDYIYLKHLRNMLVEERECALREKQTTLAAELSNTIKSVERLLSMH